MCWGSISIPLKKPPTREPDRVHTVCRRSWVEFLDKRKAKTLAAMLNGQQIGAPSPPQELPSHLVLRLVGA